LFFKSDKDPVQYEGQVGTQQKWHKQTDDSYKWESLWRDIGYGKRSNEQKCAYVVEKEHDLIEK
jgi:hypothetical protein